VRRLLALPVLALLGCGPVRAHAPRPEPVVAPRPLGADDPLPTGPAATAQRGDWLITTGEGRVRFVVGALGHKEGFQATGGNLLDLSLDGLPDQFDGISTWFEREFPRQGAYDEVFVDGAALVVRGVDSADASVRVETRWEPVPPPDGVIGSLRITTTVTAASAHPAFDLGDIVGWGGLRHFAPGPGFALKGQDLPLPWIGAEAADHAVLLVGEGPVTGPHGASWSDPVWASPDLAADAPQTYARTLHVGTTMAALLGATGATRRVRIEARETGSGSPIPEAGFTLARDGAPYAVGRVQADGTLQVALPEEPFTVTLSQRGRRSAGPAAIPVDATRGVAEASPEGTVAARIVGPEGPVAGRLTWFGRDGTPDPDLGPLSMALGGNRANLAHPGRFPVPPGRYSVVATRGPTWSQARADVEVPEGEIALEFALRPLVPTAGWMQCDLHQHAAYSSDSAIPPVDGVIASVAEGLDCIATTEHDAVADWTQHVQDAALLDPMIWLSGIEVTSNKEGHYNVYPYPPALGPIEHAGLDPFQITAAIRARAPEAVLQVNHPRYGAIGVYNRLEDPARIARLDGDAIEVLNGKDTAGAQRILDDVARSLARGVHPALVGASDSHHLVGQERGSARTYVAVGEARTPQGVRDALRDRRASTASNGPLLSMQATGRQVDVTLLAPEWMVVDTVALHAGSFGEGAPQGLGEPLAVWAVEGAPVDGLVRRAWTATVPGTGQQWVLAVARGSRDMEPWLDAPPWAVTSPILLP
jgi:predicted metal-dependent phosphoesterase TrpH